MSKSSANLALMCAALGSFPISATGGYGGFRLPKPGKQINREPYPEILVKPAPPANNSRVDGKDRNAPCECGCGKKRKKCPNGHLTIEPPAHELSLGDYQVQVARHIEEKTGLTHVAEMYKLSHTDKYWADQVITPERCAELVLQMYQYDSEPMMQAVTKEINAEVLMRSARHQLPEQAGPAVRQVQGECGSGDTIVRPAKGELGGECNRTACDRWPASCYNNSTLKHYCVPCARAINQYNPGCCVLPEGI